MGTSAYHIDLQSLPGHDPPLSQYQLASSGPSFYIYQNPISHKTILQYIFPFTNKQLLHSHLQSYLWRYNHPVLVSTLYYKQHSQKQNYSIFYQKVLTNLHKIKDISFQDSLQFYYICFKGFELLYEEFGYFQIEEDMIFITQDGKIKVWCDCNISRLFPVGGGHGNQVGMISKLIKIIDTNMDHSKQVINIANVLRKQNIKTFKKATYKFVKICKQFCFQVNGKLQCVDVIKSLGVNEAVGVVNVVNRYNDKLIGKDNINLNKQIVFNKGNAGNNSSSNLNCITSVNNHNNSKLNVLVPQNHKSVNNLNIFSPQKPIFIPPRPTKNNSLQSLHYQKNKKIIQKPSILFQNLSFTTNESLRMSKITFSPNIKLNISQSRERHNSLKPSKIEKPSTIQNKQIKAKFNIINPQKQLNKKKPIKAYFTYYNKFQHTSITQNKIPDNIQQKIKQKQQINQKQQRKIKQKIKYHDGSDFKQLVKKLRQKYCNKKILDYDQIFTKDKDIQNINNQNHQTQVNQRRQINIINYKTINIQKQTQPTGQPNKQQQQNTKIQNKLQKSQQKQKKYIIKIDNDIWDDMLKLKKKNQQHKI